MDVPGGGVGLVAVDLRAKCYGAIPIEVRQGVQALPEFKSD
jgi:hypothetical protein